MNHADADSAFQVWWDQHRPSRIPVDDYKAKLEHRATWMACLEAVREFEAENAAEAA